MKPSPPADFTPLFSTFVALYTLILLYLPSFFLNLLFSPVFIAAGVLLLCILRSGASQSRNRSPIPPHSDIPDPGFRGSFVEWDVGAPLEVIHEVCCEGEDAPDDAVYPSLSRYYPETDSESDCGEPDSGSEMEGAFPVMDERGFSPERRWFRWAGEEIDEEGGLIEIRLDGECGKGKVVEELGFYVEEESFIEIDISPVHAGGR